MKKPVSFRTKLFMLIACIIAGIFLCTFCMILPFSTHRMEINSEYQLEQDGVHTVASLNYFLDQMRSIYLSISSDVMLQEELDAVPSQAASLRYQYLMKKLDTLTTVFVRSYSVYLYDIGGNNFFTSDTLSTTALMDDKWVKNAEYNEGMRNFVLSQDENFSSTSFIMIGGILRYHIIGRPLAYFSVNAKTAVLQSLIFPTPLTPGTLQGMYGADGSYLFGGLQDFDLSSVNASSGKISKNGMLYQYCVTESEDYQWKYVALVPVSEMYASINALRSQIFLLLLLALAAALFIAYFASSKVTYPIRVLSEAVNSYRNSNSGSISIPNLRRNDEFKILNDGLINMADRINHLIENVYRAELENRKMELRILHRAINPHFIYNVLENIYWTLQLNQTEKASKTILDFSHYLRSTLTFDQQMESLGHLRMELNAYCELQKVFSHETVSWQVNFPEELLTYRIPGMLVQPLVENSYVHAFPPEWKKKGCIRVTAERNAGKLLLRVEDDGMGMKGEDLEQVKQVLADPQDTAPEDQSSRFFAFRNIQTRIHIQYGRQWGLSVESSYLAGSSFCLSLPFAAEQLPAVPPSAGGGA